MIWSEGVKDVLCDIDTLHDPACCHGDTCRYFRRGDVYEFTRSEIHVVRASCLERLGAFGRRGRHLV